MTRSSRCAPWRAAALLAFATGVAGCTRDAVGGSEEDAPADDTGAVSDDDAGVGSGGTTGSADTGDEDTRGEWGTSWGTQDSGSDEGTTSDDPFGVCDLVPPFRVEMMQTLVQGSGPLPSSPYECEATSFVWSDPGDSSARMSLGLDCRAAGLSATEMVRLVLPMPLRNFAADPGDRIEVTLDGMDVTGGTGGTIGLGVVANLETGARIVVCNGTPDCGAQPGPVMTPLDAGCAAGTGVCPVTRRMAIDLRADGFITSRLPGSIVDTEVGHRVFIERATFEAYDPDCDDSGQGTGAKIWAVIDTPGS